MRACVACCVNDERAERGRAGMQARGQTTKRNAEGQKKIIRREGEKDNVHCRICANAPPLKQHTPQTTLARTRRGAKTGAGAHGRKIDNPKHNDKKTTYATYKCL